MTAKKKTTKTKTIFLSRKSPFFILSNLHGCYNSVTIDFY